MSENFPILIKLNQTHPIPLDISLHCHKNETLVLLGPSGSGKSTVLRSIAGLHKSKNGSITIKNETWLDTDKSIDLKPQQRSVGFMFQEYALFPHKTAKENILLALPEDTVAHTKLKAEAILEQIHLSGLGERYPSELSGGQQQRVALGRALARNPDILLLDEPFSSLDQLTKQKLIREIIRLKKDLELPIILVTHDLDEARTIADRICVIHHGCSLQEDKTDVLFKKPNNRTIARLLDLKNIFRAIIKEHKQEENKTLLDWNGTILECRYDPRFSVRDSVDCVIPTENIILHRKDKPSNGKRENPVHACINESLNLGQQTHIIAKTNKNDLFFLSVSSHVAKRNKLYEKEDISFSLLANAIHLMPTL